MSNPPNNNDSPTQSTPTSYTLPNHNKATHAAPGPAYPYPYPVQAYPNQWSPSQLERFPGNSFSPTKKPIHILAKISFGATLLALILTLLYILCTFSNVLSSVLAAETIKNLLSIIPNLIIISLWAGIISGITALSKIKSHPEWGGKRLVKASLIINITLITLGSLVALVFSVFLLKFYVELVAVFIGLINRHSLI